MSPLSTKCLFDPSFIHISSVGVRDSVSHTNRPGNPSQTAEPPVLLDLPENRSTLL